MDRFTRWWWRLVRLGFRLLYNEMAWSYDAVSWLASLGAWRAWQEAALPYVVGERVLELAHGPGHMLLALAEAGYRVTGLDLSPAMGRIAGRRLRRSAARAGIVRARAQALPFPSGHFDTLLATFPTAFITETATLREARRVLRPGGRLLVVPEGHLQGSGWLHRFINWLYVITGQRSGEAETGADLHSPAASAAAHHFCQRLEMLGFTIQVVPVSLDGSSATVIVATGR